MGHDGLLKVITKSGEKCLVKKSQPGANDMTEVSGTIYMFLEDLAGLYYGKQPDAVFPNTDPDAVETKILEAAKAYASKKGLEKTGKTSSGIMLVVDPRKRIISFAVYGMNFLEDRLRHPISDYKLVLKNHNFSVKYIHI